MSKIKSAHEVYFLVRIGQMSEEDLNTWLQANIEASHYEQQGYNDYERDWDILEEDEC